MPSFLVAVAFLTILPLRFEKLPTPETVARSRFWFPMVGLLLGALLGGWAVLVQMAAAPMLGAFLVLAAWVGITGALHLDGLADLCDGLFGGTTPEGRLQIMKDPRVGTFGVVGATLLLLGKFAALADLMSRMPEQVPFLVGAAVMGARCLVLSMAANARYPRPDGTGKLLIEATTRGEGVFSACLALVVLCAGIWGAGIGRSLAAAGSSLLAMATLRLSCVRRLGGVTGDCLGAGIEFAEVIFLLTAACLVPDS